MSHLPIIFLSEVEVLNNGGNIIIDHGILARSDGTIPLKDQVSFHYSEKLKCLYPSSDTVPQNMLYLSIQYFYAIL